MKSNGAATYCDLETCSMSAYRVQYNITIAFPSEKTTDGFSCVFDFRYEPKHWTTLVSTWKVRLIPTSRWRVCWIHQCQIRRLFGNWVDMSRSTRWFFRFFFDHLLIWGDRFCSLWLTCLGLGIWSNAQKYQYWPEKAENNNIE